MVEKMNKKGQIAIFIILALIIIVGVIIIFLLFNPPEIKILDEKNPQASVESCTREAVEEAIEILSRQGGDIQPKGFIRFKGEEITYLCFNYDYYDNCINQRPLLIEHIENEITDYIRPKVEACFNDLKNLLENRYEIETSEMKISTKLHSKNVIVEIDKKFKMSRGDEVREFDDFRMHMVHPIYDFANIAMNIVNQESRYCNFDELGFMILYPNYDITKFITGEADVIYKIKERSTGEEFDFAVRSCVLPAGW